MVKGVSWTYCGQCCRCTTGAKDHITTNNIHREVILDNSQGENTPAATNKAPTPTAGVLSQSETANNTAGGVNPKSSMAGDLGGNHDIGGNSVYDDGPLSLVGQLFIGGTVTSESNPNASDDVYVGAPEFCSDDLFFSDELRD